MSDFSHDDDAGAFERKIVPLTGFKVLATGDADGSHGKFAGYGSVFNELDLVGDTVLPGAYAATLPKFLRDGFISWGHDWDAPIATIDVAREDERGLWLEASFHSTAEAQRARTIASERLARGKSMGLSIGFATNDFSLRADGVRELRAIELMETSLVTVPAEPRAQVTAVKSARDVRLLDWLERAAGTLRVDAKEGRVLSARNVERLRALVTELEDLLAAAAPASASSDDAPEDADDDDAEKARAAISNGEGLRAWAEFQRTAMQIAASRRASR